VHRAVIRSICRSFPGLLDPVTRGRQGMNWKQLIRDRILANLAARPISQKAKDEIVEAALEDTEAGRPFGAADEDEERKKKKKGKPPIILGPLDTEPIADPITSRGEKLSDLRKEAHRWGGWEV